MQQLTKAFGDAVVGVTSGFDRIVFQGVIRPLMFVDGAMNFFRRRNILFVDARDWVLARTDRLVKAIDTWSRDNCGEGTTYLSSSSIRKDEAARTRQQAKGISSGLIGTWSCLERNRSYRIAYGEGAPVLKSTWAPHKHVYIYLDHPQLGFMSVRIQTWFPYRIQIALNGREWAARQLEKTGVGFEKLTNKFLHVDDYDVLQRIFDQQLNTNWPALLDSLVPLGFPTLQETLGPKLGYWWTLWQSEWATDLLFRDRAALDAVMDPLVRHAFIGGHPERLLRYFGQPLKKDGSVRANYRGSLKTSLTHHDEAWRIRHWLDANSVKAYNFFNVLRVESTINNPAAFRAYRTKEGAEPDAKKHFLPIRKGVADTVLRARASQQMNDRLVDFLASTRSSEPLGDLFSGVTRRIRRRGRSVRALDPTGKDLVVLKALADPRFAVSGFSNKELRAELGDDPRYRRKTDRQRSAMTTRQLRLLRDHGVIRRLPKSRRYQLTAKGRALVTALQAALAASTEQLAAIAA